ncbi:MAG: hypothetical protein AAGF12_09410 [Myxococcota bacterium]
MAKAPTPPPHTFVSYLEAGGSAFFSARCQTLLISAGLNPEWFGGYDAVGGKIAEAKDRCNRWDAMDPDERAAGGIMPSREDRFLARCTTGHLAQDGVFRNRGQPRGNPCSNRIDGYVEGFAPCVASEGRSGDPASVEGSISDDETLQRWEQYEQEVAAGRGQTVPRVGQPDLDYADYPEPTRHADEDYRTGSLLERTKGRFNEPGLPPIPSATTGPTDPLLDPDQFDQAKNMLGASEPTDPDLPEAAIVDGESAASCINTWRRRAEAEMKEAGPQREIESLREAEANLPAARQELANAQAAETAAETALQNAQNTGASQEEIDRLSAANRLASSRRSRAQQQVRRGENAPTHIPCLQAQQQRIQTGTNETVGTVWPN